MEEDEGRRVEEEEEEEIPSAQHSQPHGAEMSHIQLVERATLLPRMVQRQSDSEEEDVASSQHLEHTRPQDHDVRSSQLHMTHSSTSQHPLHVASPPPGQRSSPSPQGVCVCISIYLSIYLIYIYICSRPPPGDLCGPLDPSIIFPWQPIFFSVDA